MSEIREAAVSWAKAGFCVLPTKHHDKAPAVNTWRQYVRQKGSTNVPAAPSAQIVDRWFANEQTGLGLILGATSGNAEMFEFEGRAIHEGIFADFAAFAETNGAGEIWTRLKAGYVERTPSGGLHFVFRVTGGPALPNTRLAARPSTAAELAEHPEQPIQVLVETRGEGGFVVIAPSTMPGRAWVQTGRGEVAHLSVEERDQLYEVARMFDAVPEYVRKEVPPREKVEGALSPLDDFRARTDWADILEPHGWTHVGLKADGRDAWLRPGKDFGEGWALSATTGNTDGTSDSLYIFSTSTDLPALTGLSKEFVWAHYNTGGDLSEAARELRSLGHGDDGDWVSAAIVPGCTNPFDDGFDPMAWARKRAAENVSAAGPVPMVAPVGESGNEELASGEFHALDWVALDTEDYVQEWVVEGFLPARRAMALYSAPKLGKSLLMLEMAAHVSIGSDFLGMATTACTVLYVDHENDPRGDIWPRLKAMGFRPEQLGNLKVLSFPDMATLDTEAGGQALIRAVAQFRAGLVIIDTVSRTIKGEENSNDTWLQLYLHTGKLLKAAEIPYVRLDHSGKDESKGQRGGSAKSGDVDAIWQLVGLGSGKFLLKLDGGRMTFPREVLNFTRLRNPTCSVMGTAVRAEDGTFTTDLTGTSETRTRISNQIMERLSVPGTEGLSQNQLALCVTGKRATVLDVLESLKDSEVVICEPYGKTIRYRLNPAKPAPKTGENPFRS